MNAGTGQQGSVRCSVVVAARDEEARIEDTVRHLLAQRGVELEVVVVDDRSTDRTAPQANVVRWWAHRNLP